MQHPHKTMRQVRKRRRGGGGPQRAYFAQQLRERKLRMNMPGVCAMLHAEYRGLPAGAKKQLRELGGKATTRWRLGGKDSAFGTAAVRKERARRAMALRLSVSRRLQALSPEEAAIVLADSAAQECGSNALGGQAFSQSLRTAKSDMRLHQRGAKDSEIADLRALQQWHLGDGKDLVNTFLDSFANDKREGLSEFFVAEPGNKVSTLHFAPATARNVAAFAGFVSKDSKSNLKAAIREHWDMLHTTVLEAESRPLPEPTQRAEPSPCFAAGVCLCCPQGRRLKSLVDHFYKAFKKIFPAKGPGRKAKVKVGLVVCRFVRDEGKGVAQAGGAPVLEQEGGGPEVWMHIGMLYLSPLRATFAGMKRPASDNIVDGDAPQVLLESTAMYFTDYDALARLSLCDSWTVEFWELQAGERPIGAFAPGTVWAERSGHEAQLVWPPPPRRQRRRPLPQGQLAAIADAEEESEHMGTEDSDSEPGWGSDLSNQEGPDDDEDDQILALLHDIMADEVVEGVGIEEALGDGTVAGDAPPDQGAPAAAPDPAEPPAPSVAVDAVAPPPPPAMLRNRGRATSSVALVGGTMAYYESKSSFQAVCNNALHGNCVLTRGSSSRAHMSGRPCGLLAAWLMSSALFETKEEHWAYLDELRDDRDARIAARDELRADLDGLAVMGHERAKAQGEADEPQ